MSCWKIEIPDDLKVRVAQELKKRKNIRRITQKVKDKLTAEIGELKLMLEDAKEIDDDAPLDHVGLRTADPEEKIALQAVYQYLNKLGLRYTLQTLIHESTIENDESGIDLDELFIVGGEIHEISESDEVPFEEEEEEQRQQKEGEY
jgi:hypothetical protein